MKILRAPYKSIKTFLNPFVNVAATGRKVKTKNGQKILLDLIPASYIADL